MQENSLTPYPRPEVVAIRAMAVASCWNHTTRGIYLLSADFDAVGNLATTVRVFDSTGSDKDWPTITVTVGHPPPMIFKGSFESE